MKHVIHHIITGADYTERGRPGWGLRASTLNHHGRMPSISSLYFADAGTITGPTALSGRPVHLQWQGASQWVWVEGNAWPDSSVDRCKLRADGRSGYSRTHLVVWPSEGVACRLRHLVPFVDPVTIDPQLLTAPPPTTVDDSPCPHCDGTGSAL